MLYEVSSAYTRNQEAAFISIETLGGLIKRNHNLQTPVEQIKSPLLCDVELCEVADMLVGEIPVRRPQPEPGYRSTLEF